MALGLFLFFHTPVTNAETIEMATGEWIPFTSASMENYGNLTELVSVVIKEMGFKTTYRFYPWPRCYDSVEKGRLWAAFPYSYTQERAKEVMYSDAISCSKTVFFYYDRESDTTRVQFNRLEDLKNYKIGGVSGYFYEMAFQKAGLTVDYVNKEAYGLEKLKLGRIDFMPLNELVGRHLIINNFPNDADKFKTLPKPLSIEPLYLIVSKTYPNSKQLLDRFNTVLKRCREKGLVKISTCQ